MEVRENRVHVFYGGGLLFLGLHEVVYAGRPAGRPAFEARRPVGPVGNTART